MTARRQTWAALVLLLVLASLLRLYHVRDPILDHPAWRQGDEASIARNFLQLQNSVLYPQTDYDGPPPNYVELELQLVPYAAAQLYRAFGVHEVFGRLIVVAFSVATVLLVYGLGAELFGSSAGVAAALLFAVAPGAVYYGRTFMPESDMLFFSTGVLLFWWRWLRRGAMGDFLLAVLFGALAWLAKPPALLVLAPLLAATASAGGARAARGPWVFAFLALTLAPFFLYYAHLQSIAEWHWASGITVKHVLPALQRELTQPVALLQGLQSALALVRMLSTTVLGPALFSLALLGWFALPYQGSEAGQKRWFFRAWLLALAAYTLVVVNVERVDYYLLPFVPFAALVAGGALTNVWRCLGLRATAGRWVWAATVSVFFIAYSNSLEIHAYYTWSRPVYSAATELNAKLERNTLIVMGHYDPAVLYTIGRKGWEEDVLLWDVHDMTSAIAKGARYFVAIEVPRFKANEQLYAFMQRYRRVAVASGWQVYDMRHFAAKPR